MPGVKKQRYLFVVAIQKKVQGCCQWRRVYASCCIWCFGKVFLSFSSYTLRSKCSKSFHVKSLFVILRLGFSGFLFSKKTWRGFQWHNHFWMETLYGHPVQFVFSSVSTEALLVKKLFEESVGKVLSRKDSSERCIGWLYQPFIH